MITTTTTARRGGLAAIALAGAALLSATSVSAQGTALDVRWQGWLGCWQPVTANAADNYSAWMDQRARDAGAPSLCIVPSSSANSVDFVTVARDGKVTARESVSPDTHGVARERDGCSGTETAEWSTDARRLYVGSRYSCPNGLTRTTSGMLAMSGNGQLVDVEEVATGGAKSVRVARYQSVAPPAGFALDSAVVPNASSLPVSTARAALSGALTGADIADAVHSVDTLVVEAWLVERGDRFKVDAHRLAALADAGVPGRITDLMIALAYPKVFALDQSLRVATTLPRGSTIYATLPPPDPFGYRYGGYGGYPAGYGPLGYSPYLYSPLGFGYTGYGYGSGYGGYGYGYGGYVYQPPVVIIRNPNGGSGHTHGRVVNGEGYTRGGSSGSTGTTGVPRSASGGSSSSSGSTSAGSTSSGSTSSSSGSSSSGETRQAKPRP
jgi:hypothetical protein